MGLEAYWHTGTDTASASYTAIGEGQGQGCISYLVSIDKVRSEDLGEVRYIDRG